MISKVTKIRNYVLGWFVFQVSSVSARRYTCTVVMQDTQQAVLFDTYGDSNSNPLKTVLCVLAQLMIFVHLLHLQPACYILYNWNEAISCPFILCSLIQHAQKRNILCPQKSKPPWSNLFQWSLKITRYLLWIFAKINVLSSNEFILLNP